MKLNQIAINSVSTKQADIEEALKAYAAAGFTQVEFVIPQVKAWLAAAPGRTSKDVKALLDKHKMKCIGGFETTLQAFGDPAARKANHALHAANAKLISELSGGAPATIVVGTDGDEKNNLDTLKAIGQAARELIGQFPANVALAVEFNWSPVVKSLRSAAIVAEAADHPRVGILFDPAHFHCTPSKFDDLTEAVVKKILHVHVDDMRDKPGDRSDCNGDRVLPGEGVVGLKNLLGRIEALGYKGSFSIEMFNADLWAMPAGEAAKKMYGSMAKLCS
jgi:2-keto-myo-inositol isomerase